jgi:solute carrier family 35 (UDP-sugar transporter), member A1/2/3
MSEPSTPKVLSTTPRPPRKWLRWLHVNRLPLAWVVLILLVVQNAATTMLVQHTRRHPGASGVIYLGSVAVLISECLKLPTCLALIISDEGGVRAAVARIQDAVFDRWRDTVRMSVPALCFGLQNLLFFVALSNLSATSYQLWSQTKVLFTALFFVKILDQRLRPKQWGALGLLTVGVGAVQLAEAGTETAKAAALAARGSATTGSTSVTAAAAAAADATSASGSVTVGVIAVLLSSLLSGFANIYFEKVLKQADCEFDDSCELPEEEGGRPRAPVSLWVRNVQLALFSIPQAALLLLLSGHSRQVIASHGLFAGFTPLVWLVTALTAGGGLLVAAVVKYADNVLKTYATAVSIVLTCVFGTITTGVPPTPGFMGGMCLVLLSMLLYNDVEKAVYKKPLAWLARARRRREREAMHAAATSEGAGQSHAADAEEQPNVASADVPL